MDHIYNIPDWNKAKLEKYIKSLQRKGLDVNITEIGREPVMADGIEYMCTQYSIEDKVLYQEEGWQFIGTIEHKENGNIIRKAVDVEVPERYYTAPNECEHCHTIRNRIDTYLVRHIEDNDFKQVGKSCLKAYTGLNPALCALSMTLWAELEKFEMNEEEIISTGHRNFSSFRGYNTDRINQIAYAEIKSNGYRREGEYAENSRKYIPSTRIKVNDLYVVKDAPVASDEEIAEVDNWVSGLDTSNDYYRNAKIAYESEYCEPRDLGLICSLIFGFFKNKAKQAEKAAREEARKKMANTSQEVGYLGEVGDKVEFEVAADSILFVNQPFTYGGEFTYTHRIIDTNGHIILWTTANKYDWEDSNPKGKWHKDDNTFKTGLKIKATVKAHKEFRGELQTVVTRGKFI